MTAAEKATLGAVDYYRRAHPPKQFKMKTEGFFSPRKGKKHVRQN